MARPVKKRYSRTLALPRFLIIPRKIDRNLEGQTMPLSRCVRVRPYQLPLSAKVCVLTHDGDGDDGDDSYCSHLPRYVSRSDPTVKQSQKSMLFKTWRLSRLTVYQR